MMWKCVHIQASVAVPIISFCGPFLRNKRIKEQQKNISSYTGLSAWHVSEIETSPVSELTMVLMKIDLRQADNSIYLGVNHPWNRALCHTKTCQTKGRGFYYPARWSHVHLSGDVGWVDTCFHVKNVNGSLILVFVLNFAPSFFLAPDSDTPLLSIGWLFSAEWFRNNPCYHDYPSKRWCATRAVLVDVNSTLQYKWKHCAISFVLIFQ